jgi:hypothetical protein
MQQQTLGLMQLDSTQSHPAPILRNLWPTSVGLPTHLPSHLSSCPNALHLPPAQLPALPALPALSPEP